MPATETTSKIRAKVGGSFLDADEYMRVNNAWVKREGTVVEPPPTGSDTFTPGIVAGADATKGPQGSQLLGAKVARVEFDIANATSLMDARVAAFADRGVKCLLLAGFSGRIPSVADCNNLANWVNRFGPGGTFWSSRSDGHLAVTHIEFGNETSFGYQYGDTYNTASYISRAQNYALRFKDGATAITNTGKNVQLLCQGEDGGSGSANWVNNMYVTVPDLHTRVGGWIIHPYGNVWYEKMDRMINFLAARGAPNTIPIDITEWGLSTDNGATVYQSGQPNNYGWPANQTYAQAGTALTQTVTAMLARPNLGSRLRHFMYYAAHDLTAPGGKRCTANAVAVACREDFFGALKNDLTDKVGISGPVRTVMGMQTEEEPEVPPNKPVVIPAVGATAATLRLGSATGPRVNFKGINVWGLPDSVTLNSGSGTQHHANQYAARNTIASTIKSWGGSMVRMRVLADAYNSAPSTNTANLTKAQFIQRVKDWRDAVVAQGMYFMPCSWDALDGAFSGATWAGNGFRVHQMFADIYAALGNDPMVIYEITNEPNNVTWDQWQTNMLASITYFRETIGYKGVLVIDPIWWANSGIGGQGYDDTRYTTLETHDAARAGMNGKHQLVFAKHDYAMHYANKVWSATSWANSGAGNQTKHLIFETEYGNYNGSPTTVDDTWAAQAAHFFSTWQGFQSNYVGGAAFVWGAWTDANALTAVNNTTPTTWGTSVRNGFGGTVTPVGTALALPRGAVSGFGQAADFYDTVGVNIHFLNEGAYPSTATVNDLGALGVRHVRDSSYATWYHAATFVFRNAHIRMIQRNTNLPAPSSTDMGQPIFLHCNVTGWPGHLTNGQFGNPNEGGPFNKAYTAAEFIQQFVGGHQHYDGNANNAATIPGVGYPIPNGTTANYLQLKPNPWNFNDPEAPSEILSALAGPNEPVAEDNNYSGIKAWLADINQRASLETRTVLGGLPYVADGEIKAGPAQFKQLPIHGVLKYGGDLASYGNMGAGTNTCDTGDYHPYHVGHEPSQEYMDRILQRDPDPHPGLPKMITEWGHISSGVADLGVPGPAPLYNGGTNVFSSIGFHAGYWPTPDDVIAEFMVRTIILFYKRGIRRSFIYEFMDEGTDPNAAEAGFGIIKLTGRVRKQQFYSIRNLLSCVGFVNAPSANRRAIPYQISGFVSQGNNNHIAMFQGQGDPGAVGPGGVYHTNRDILDPLLLQRSATEYILCVPRQVMIWDREPGNWNTATGRPGNLVNEAAGRKTPTTQNLIVSFPEGVSEVCEVTPTAGGITTPELGRTWSAPKAISSASGDEAVNLQIQGKTKLLRIRI